MILKKKEKKKKEKNLHLFHPPSPLDTRRLKSQHHEIITTFLFSTPRHDLALSVTTLRYVATITITLAQMVYQVVTRGGMVSYIYILYKWLVNLG